MEAGLPSTAEAASSVGEASAASPEEVGSAELESEPEPEPEPELGLDPEPEVLLAPWDSCDWLLPAVVVGAVVIDPVAMPLPEASSSWAVTMPVGTAVVEASVAIVVAAPAAPVSVSAGASAVLEEPEPESESVSELLEPVAWTGAPTPAVAVSSSSSVDEEGAALA